MHVTPMKKITWKCNLRIFCSLGDNEAKSQNEIMCDLGELAELDTVNDADPLNLLTDARFKIAFLIFVFHWNLAQKLQQYFSNSRRSWNHKYTLRSHLDGVRSVKFHPTEPLVLSGSEDQLVKVRTLKSKRTY